LSGYFMTKCVFGQHSTDRRSHSRENTCNCKNINCSWPITITIM